LAQFFKKLFQMSQSSNSGNSLLNLGESEVWHRDMGAVYSVIGERMVGGVYGLYLQPFFDMSPQFVENNVYDVAYDSFDAESIAELREFYLADWTGNSVDEFDMCQFIEHMQMVRSMSNEDRIARVYTNHTYWTVGELQQFVQVGNSLAIDVVQQLRFQVYALRYLRVEYDHDGSDMSMSTTDYEVVDSGVDLPIAVEVPTVYDVVDVWWNYSRYVSELEAIVGPTLLDLSDLNQERLVISETEDENHGRVVDMFSPTVIHIVPVLPVGYGVDVNNVHMEIGNDIVYPTLVSYRYVWADRQYSSDAFDAMIPVIAEWMPDSFFIISQDFIVANRY
jgi:hypothetical protein